MFFTEGLFFSIYHNVFYFAIKRRVSLSKRCPNVDPILLELHYLNGITPTFELSPKPPPPPPNHITGVYSTYCF